MAQAVRVALRPDPFEGRYQEKGESKRAAVCIGPEYDTVGYDLVGARA